MEYKILILSINTLLIIVWEKVITMRFHCCALFCQEHITEIRIQTCFCVVNFIWHPRFAMIITLPLSCGLVFQTLYAFALQYFELARGWKIPLGDQNGFWSIQESRCNWLCNKLIGEENANQLEAFPGHASRLLLMQWIQYVQMPASS